MRLSARQLLRFFMIVVAIGASSLNGYAAVLAAFDTHAHGHHGVHSHPAHDVDQHANAPGESQVLDVADSHDDGSEPDGQACKHVHAHCCCASVVVPANVSTLAAFGYVRSSVPIADSAIPHGQLASPLYRPPRAIA